MTKFPFWSPPRRENPRDQRHNLQDVFTSYAPLFSWLRSRQPIAKIGYSIFIYDLIGDSEGLMKLKEVYAMAGM